MKYESTRGSREFKSSTAAIIRGIAEDRGLYVPAAIPPLPLKIDEMKGMTYQQIAYHVIGAYFDEYTSEELQRCIDGANDSKCEAEEIVPVV